jgi:hypothetical protein
VIVTHKEAKLARKFALREAPERWPARAGNPYRRGRICTTVDLLIKVAGFVKK